MHMVFQEKEVNVNLNHRYVTVMFLIINFTKKIAIYIAIFYYYYASITMKSVTSLDSLLFESRP